MPTQTSALILARKAGLPRPDVYGADGALRIEWHEELPLSPELLPLALQDEAEELGDDLRSHHDRIYQLFLTLAATYLGADCSCCTVERTLMLKLTLQ